MPVFLKNTKFWQNLFSDHLSSRVPSSDFIIFYTQYVFDSYLIPDFTWLVEWPTVIRNGPQPVPCEQADPED